MLAEDEGLGDPRSAVSPPKALGLHLWFRCFAALRRTDEPGCAMQVGAYFTAVDINTCWDSNSRCILARIIYKHLSTVKSSSIIVDRIFQMMAFFGRFLLQLQHWADVL